jgi:antitoxin component YwqK of YwqJK toxin-antitoxin module
LKWEKKRDIDGKVVGQYNFNNELNYGLKVEYYKNGQLHSSLKYADYKLEFINNGLQFVQGKFGDIIGDYITFYENGQIYEKGQYKNGLKNGQWTIYYDNGNIKQKINYDEKGTPKKNNYDEQGNLYNATISYDENGQIY